MKVLNISFDDMMSPGGGLGVFNRDMGNAMGKYADVTTVTYDPHMERTFFGQYGNQRLLMCKNVNYQMNVTGPYHLLSILNLHMQNILYHLGNEHFDIIHNHDTACFPVAEMCSALFKAPIVTTCHLSFGLVHETGHILDQDQYRWELTQEAFAYHSSDAMVTMSEAYAEKLANKFFINRPIDLIANGVDTEALSDVTPNLEYKREIAGNKPLVGFVGRMVPSKGILNILDAAEALPDHHFLINSYLAPSVEKVQALVVEVKKRIERLDNVTWISDMPSHDPEKWRIMQACDIAMIPSHHEPFGIVALEWGALKVPKIVTKIDGLVDHNNEQNAIMIEADNSEQLIKAIKNYKPDPCMIDKAYQVALDHNWDKVAKQYMEIYKRCLKAPGN